MTKRMPVEPAPGPWKGYAARFDDLFSARAQREGSRTPILEGALLPPSVTDLEALANTEPVTERSEGKRRVCNGSFRVRVGPEGGQRAPPRILFEEGRPLASGKGVMVIDETATANGASTPPTSVGQWSGHIGKTDNGVVSVQQPVGGRGGF